jgi:DNA repair exonuclease SbcCD nuclease subunit
VSLSILVPDVHLGKSLSLGKAGIGSQYNSRIDDQVRLLEWILEQAIELVVSDLILSGDIFESVRPEPYLMAIFIAWCKKCQLHDIRVHIILGNHDILRNGFSYSSSLDVLVEADLDGIHVYKNMNTIIIDTTAFTLLPFRDRKSLMASTNQEAIAIMRDSLIYELSSIPSTYQKVAVGHFAIEGSLPIDEIDDLTNELFCPLDLFTGYDSTFMGHIHTPQVMQESPYVAHIGSLDISNFGEHNQKKHIVVFDCANGSFYHKILPTRALQKIIISVPKGTEDSTAYVLDQIKEVGISNSSIVKVEVSLTVPELSSINKSVIDKFLISNGAFLVNGISESKKINLIKKDDANIISTKMDVKSAIKTYSQLYVGGEMQEPFIEVMMDIYGQVSE